MINFVQQVGLSWEKITALAVVVLLKEDKHMTLKIIAGVLATVGLIIVQR